MSYKNGTDRLESNREITRENVMMRYPGRATVGRYNSCGMLLGTSDADKCGATTQHIRTTEQTTVDDVDYDGVSLNETSDVSCDTCAFRTIHPKEYRDSGKLLTTTANRRANGSNVHYHLDQHEPRKYRDILRDVYDERKCSQGISGEYGTCSAMPQATTGKGAVLVESLTREQMLGEPNVSEEDSPEKRAAITRAYNQARGIETN